MNKNNLIALAIIVVTILFGYLLHLNYHRYYIMTTSRGLAYEVDRITGKTWVLGGNTKRLQIDKSPSKKKLTNLPLTELKKLTGRASLSSLGFSGSLYNGTEWIIKEVSFYVTVKETDGSTRWSREYTDDVHIELKSSGDVFFSITGGHEFDSFSWDIISAKGFK